MLCKVCSREINTTTFETLGNQIVCSLSCVGLLQANEEDKCNECQRPVWKDNYYIIDSKLYCSEKCKKKVVKNHLKKFNTIHDISIKHFENQFFKNDSPMKNLKELRKEVKEFYKDFDIDETATMKSIPISCKSTFRHPENKNNTKIVEDIKDSISSMAVTQPKNSKKVLSLKKYIKKYPVIPNRLSKNSVNKNNSFYKDKKSDKRAISRRRNIENFLKQRKNHSFDNYYRSINNNDKDEDIVFQLKYVNKRNNSINSDKKSKKRTKLKQTILKLKNNNNHPLKTKFARYQIPNPIIYQYNLKEAKNPKYNNYRYYEGSYENKENKNDLNIHYVSGNYFEKNYLNDKFFDNKENNYTNQNFIERNDNYRYETNNRGINNSYF